VSEIKFSFRLCFQNWKRPKIDNTATLQSWPQTTCGDLWRLVTCMYHQPPNVRIARSTLCTKPDT